MFSLKNIFDKKKFYGTVTLQRFQPIFTTVDGKEHKGQAYNWANQNALLCPVFEYLSMDAKCDGFLQDEQAITYPFNNILSIEWKLVEEITVLNDFHIKDFTIFYDNNDVSKMTIVNNSVIE